MNVELIKADYAVPEHRQDILQLMNDYALDPMGGGEALADEVQTVLLDELAKLDYAHSFIAYVDAKPAGLVNCFEGFSTFAAKPLINIHDLVVTTDYRGLGISQFLLDGVEQLAKQKGCCKITLEVLSQNLSAQNAYRKFGFAQYELAPSAGQALFWQKSL